MKKIICIVGPTGSGKSGFSIDLAEYFINNSLNVHIINADSRQVYRDFPLITAQPSAEEKKDIPHFLYGILQSHEKCTAGLWLDLVHEEIKKAYENNAIPVLVGGTGMYIKALTEGIAQIPAIPSEISEKILQELDKEGIEKMYAKLQVIDEIYANKIHKNDRQRICRALEVYTHTGQNLSHWHSSAQGSSRYQSFKIGIGLPLSPIDELNPYLIKRTEMMLKDGAIEEAKKAYEICPNLKAPAWTGIGCIEIGKYITNTYALEKCKEEWNKNTRAYAKRQWTWFRADKAIEWCHPFDKERRNILINKALDFINEA